MADDPKKATEATASEKFAKGDLVEFEILKDFDFMVENRLVASYVAGMIYTCRHAAHAKAIDEWIKTNHAKLFTGEPVAQSNRVRGSGKVT